MDYKNRRPDIDAESLAINDEIGCCGYAYRIMEIDKQGRVWGTMIAKNGYKITPTTEWYEFDLRLKGWHIIYNNLK